MIQESLFALNEKLRSDLRDLIGNSPKYNLDRSWPSVGVLDLALSRLRGKKTLSQFDELVLRQASAYLGSIAYDSWTGFANGIEIDLRINAEQDDHVIISARKSALLPHRSSYSIDITAALKQLLTTSAPQIPVFEKQQILNDGARSPVCAFTLGVITGLSPYGVGPWQEWTIESAKERLSQIALDLSPGCAEFYRNCFPGEPIGAMPELYHNCLILPPLGYDEPFLGVFPLARALEGLKRANAPKDEIALLGTNLAQHGDELLGVIGCALAAGCTNTATEQLKLLLQCKAELIPQLRPAIILTRKSLGEAGDWIEELENRRFEEAERLYNLDLQLGLLPHVNISANRLRMPELLPILRSLAWGEIETAREGLDYLLRNPGYAFPEITLQAARLDAIAGENELCAQRIRELYDLRESMTLADRARFFELNGLLHQKQGNIPDAIKYFDWAVATRAPIDLAPAAEHYLECVARSGNEVALKRDSAALAKMFPASLFIRLTEGLTAVEGNEIDAEGIVAKLLQQAPNRREAFMLAITHASKLREE